MIHIRKTARIHIIATLPVLASALLASTAHAQWTVTNLHPAGATASFAIAVGGGQQVGLATVGGVDRASLWSGTAASRVDLHPAGFSGSVANAISGGQQAGSATTGGLYEASLWSGTAASRVDISPAGAGYSVIYAISGAQQAGSASIGGLIRASLWSGTAASWVSLNPAGSTLSQALAANGGQQAGYATVSGVDRASLWSGTVASWVDLNPAGSTNCWAVAMSGGQQAGYATVGGAKHASLWSGTAASWVDLNPAGAASSEVGAMSSGQQAGYATVSGVHRASLWSGTAASWVDLSTFLPAGFTMSEAHGMSSDGTNLYVCGYGFNSLTGRNEALLWMRPLCNVAPSIVTQPQAATICPAGAAMFSVTTSGIGPFTYQWRKDGAPRTDSLDHIYGATAATLVLVNTAPSDIGSYDCIVTNACGSVTSDAAALSCAPALVQPGSQPEAQVVTSNRPAFFSVHPDCCASAATYQWQAFDSAVWSNLADGDTVGNLCGVVSGATTQRLTVALSPSSSPPCLVNPLYANGRQFRCIVSNACGSVTSAAATLTIPCAADVDDGSGTGMQDGGITIDDLLYYLARFVSGC